MRYRALSATGDYTFGQQQNNFLINSSAAVAQAVMTRLKLQQGEWFINTLDGMPWTRDVLGKYTAQTYDLAIKDRILDTPGVLAITNYSSTFNGQNRTLTVSVTISTIYGSTTVQGTI